MKYDAFTGGIEPGGLRTKNDIRILICYLLSGVNAPLSGEDLSRIMQEKSLANYFEASDALSYLVSQGNVNRDGDLYTITDTGREIADSLDVTLPLSVRDKALEAALTLLAHARTERENRVELERLEKGFRVTCHISGGELDLMTISLFVPDEKQAQMVKTNFHRDPAAIYQLLLAALTGDQALAKSFFDGQEASGA